MKKGLWKKIILHVEKAPGGIESNVQVETLKV